MPKVRRTGPRLEIARRLKAARLESGLTQEVVAKKLRIRPEQWRRIEWGKTSVPSEFLLNVCAVVNKDVGTILGANEAAA